MTAYLFRNAMVWDAVKDAPFLGEVLVEGNRIRKVAQGSQPDQPRGRGPR